MAIIGIKHTDQRQRWRSSASKTKFCHPPCDNIGSPSRCCTKCFAARSVRDQTFIRDMLDDPEDLAIVVGVVALAASFNRLVIAEGVETIAHGTALLELGCELAQGYGIARPMPADQIPEWTTNWQPNTAWQLKQQNINISED